ncbi:hypothetical protein ACE0DR_28640 [Azotobacter sp. CWF10]
MKVGDLNTEDGTSMGQLADAIEALPDSFSRAVFDLVVNNESQIPNHGGCAAEQCSSHRAEPVASRAAVHHHPERPRLQQQRAAPGTQREVIRNASKETHAGGDRRGRAAVAVPAAPRYSNWFPVVHRPPEVPPVDGVTPTRWPMVSLLEWPAVDLAGVVYVVERGPSPEGPWTEIYRTTDTRYFYSDNTGAKWWFKITPTVRGRPGSGSVVEATPPPTTAELIKQTERITKEIADRMEADAAEAYRAGRWPG